MIAIVMIDIIYMITINRLRFDPCFDLFESSIVCCISNADNFKTKR